jgi:Ser/Thr protein kinase RdoA (MazF antagonist)
MDNADGGRRGLRARPGPDLLQALRDHWELNGFAEAVDLGGSSSLNLLLGDGDRRYVVRVHRSSVTPERLDVIHQARGALLAGGVPCAPVVPTRRGAPWIRLQGRLVEVEPYVEHDAVMDSWQRLEVGIALLAQVHGVLPHVEVGEAGHRPRFANHLEPADVQARTAQGTARMRRWGPTATEAGLADAADRLANLVAQAEAALVVQLPRQLAHGDFWDDNVLFRHGRPVLLADFDFMGERARVDDLALTLWCASFDLGGGTDLAQELPHLRRLVVGYDAAADLPLSAAERAALPLAMVRHPLSSIGGWVVRLDNEAAARRHAAAVAPEVRAALRVVADLDRWQDAFA